MNTEYNIENMELFEFLKLHSLTTNMCSINTVNLIYTYIKKKMSEKWDSEKEEFQNIVMSRIKGYCSTANKKWRDSNQDFSKFLNKNKKWLKLKFKVPCMTNKEESILDQPKTSRGRPKKLFSEKSDRFKRRAIKEFRESHSSQELVYATKSALYKDGKHAAADLLKHLTQFSPNRAIKIKKIIQIS